jgi:hypothetical protein
MKKNLILKIVNPLLLVLMISQLLTGVWGRELSHDAFTILHKGGGVLFAVLAAVHLLLNLNWFKTSYFRR